MINKLIILTLSFSAFAEQDTADLARSVFQQNIQQQSAAGGGNGNGTVKNINKQADKKGTGKAPERDTINRGSDVGQQSQSGGAGTNAAAGAALMAACMATQPPNMALCAMGAMAMQQSGEDSGAASDSGKTGVASVVNKAPPNPTPATGSSGFQDPNVKNGLNALKKEGYKVTSDGVTFPDGSFKPASAFASPGALASAGFDANTVKEAQKVTAAINDEISKIAGSVSGVPVASGGGGSGAGGGVSEGDSNGASADGDYSAKNPFSLDSEQRRQLIAGKTVLYDGEPIGVSGQNIFDMVHSAYNEKRERNSFIEAESDGASMRAPASVKSGRR